jgi:hypothetical protein
MSDKVTFSLSRIAFLSYNQKYFFSQHTIAWPKLTMYSSIIAMGLRTAVSTPNIEYHALILFNISMPMLIEYLFRSAYDGQSLKMYTPCALIHYYLAAALTKSLNLVPASLANIAGFPSSTISPASMTTTLSKSIIISSRWLTATTV